MNYVALHGLGMGFAYDTIQKYDNFLTMGTTI